MTDSGVTGPNLTGWSGARRLLRGCAMIAVGLALADCTGARHTSPTVSEPEALSGPPIPQRLCEPVAAYAPPGSADDPWGPYIRPAAARFGVPESWIREVMRQESGGRQYLDGCLITSPAGAIGLMQLMPATYANLRDRYGLGDDPYLPRDNILAGSAYIHEMDAKFGAPAFLAAYNAGPMRLQNFLTNGGSLPGETVAYVAAIAPRIGLSPRKIRNWDGAYATFAGDNSADDLNRRELANAGPSGTAVAMNTPTTGADALNRKELVRVGAVPAAPPPSPRQVASSAAPAPVAASFGRHPDWAIQVGAFSSAAQAWTAANGAIDRASDLLHHASPFVSTKKVGAALFYQARVTGISAETAQSSCAALSKRGMRCFVVKPVTAEG